MYELNLSSLLREKGWSQKDLAAKTGISENTISKWARKQVDQVDLRTLYVICQNLGITDLNEIIVDDGQPVAEGESEGQTALVA